MPMFFSCTVGNGNGSTEARIAGLISMDVLNSPSQGRGVTWSHRPSLPWTGMPLDTLEWTQMRRLTKLGWE
jgi:hypothetical protein